MFRKYLKTHEHYSQNSLNLLKKKTSYPSLVIEVYR